jgi:hypothetical protein
MKTAAKVSISLVLAIVLVVSGLLIYVFTSLDALVAGAIQYYGTQAIQTEVRVEQVKIGLTEGTASIGELSVANPEGFDAPHAFELGEISVAIDLQSLSAENIVIDEITILAPTLFYEMNAERLTNLNVIKDRLSGSSTASSQSEKTEETETGDVPHLTIRKFVLKDGQVHTRIVPLDNREAQVDLPPLTLSNLSGTPQEIAKQVVKQLISHTAEAVVKSGVEDELRTKLHQKIGREAQKILEKAGDSISEGIKGLVGE